MTISILTDFLDTLTPPIKMQKSILFLYTGNEKDKNEIKKNNFTYNSIIKKKLLWNEFTKVQNIIARN